MRAFRDRFVHVKSREDFAVVVSEFFERIPELMGKHHVAENEVVEERPHEILADEIRARCLWTR